MKFRLVLGFTLLASVAVADPLLDSLDTEDPSALSAGITAIETAPTSPTLADALYSAARACQDRLHDPGRALAIYERILREMPDARVAVAAGRRATVLREDVGAHGEHAARAKRLAELIANADTVGEEGVLARVSALANEPWPGAPDAALFRADLLRRLHRLSEAQAAYAEVVQRWPASPQAPLAVRGGAGNAVEAHAWTLAIELANSLPIRDPSDTVLREDMLASVRTGRLRARIYGAAWGLLIAAIICLLASLAEAIVRARRRPALLPPPEVWFLAPFGMLLVGIAYGKAMPIAPSVGVLIGATLAMAWVSGATLDLVRTTARAIRARASLHVVACALGALALGYISLVRAGLLDVIVETARYGPGT